MRVAATIATTIATLAGCQIIGGIEERPYVKKRDAGAVPPTDDPSIVDRPPANPCIDGACTHEVAAGIAFSCVRNGDGHVLCSGENAKGQVGDDSTDDRKDPAPVSGVEAATDVWAGTEHACARLGDGRATCWGSNLFGQLGDPEFSAYYRSRGGVVPGLEGVREIAAGDLHTCARTASGVVCWGNNSHGECGSVLKDRFPSPENVTALGTGADIVQIAAGGWTTCAVRADGALLCFGSNDSGELANGTRKSKAAPTAIAGLGAVAHVGMSSERVCAALRDGTVWCWGDSPDDADAGAPPATKQVEGVSRAVAVEVGTEHACARLDDATLTCWGYDLHGQLGRGRKDGGAPGSVPALTSVTAFDLGSSHSCAKASGGFYCWGYNEQGQLGDGTTTDQYDPTKVLAP